MPRIVGIREKFPSFQFATFTHEDFSGTPLIFALPTQGLGLNAFYLFLHVGLPDRGLAGAFFMESTVEFIRNNQTMFECPAALLVASTPAEADEVGYNIADVLAGNSVTKDAGEKNGYLHASEALGINGHPYRTSEPPFEPVIEPPVERYCCGWFGIMKLDPPVFIQQQMDARMFMRLGPPLVTQLYKKKPWVIQFGVGGKGARDVL